MDDENDVYLKSEIIAYAKTSLHCDGELQLLPYGDYELQFNWRMRRKVSSSGQQVTITWTRYKFHLLSVDSSIVLEYAIIRFINYANIIRDKNMV